MKSVQEIVGEVVEIDKSVTNHLNLRCMPTRPFEIRDKAGNRVGIVYTEEMANAIRGIIAEPVS